MDAETNRAMKLVNALALETQTPFEPGSRTRGSGGLAGQSGERVSGAPTRQIKSITLRDLLIVALNFN